MLQAIILDFQIYIINMQKDENLICKIKCQEVW